MRRALTLAAGIAGLLATAAAAPDEPVVLELVINGRVLGDRVVTLTPDGDVRVPAELLRSNGLGALVAGDAESVSLRDLSPRVDFELDAPKARLQIRVDPSLLGRSVVDLERGPPSGLEPVGAGSFFLNYALRATDSSAPGPLVLDVPWEIAGRLGPAAALSDFHFTTETDHLVRLISRFVLDDVEAARRLILGDFVAASPQLGSQLALGGISFARDFGLRPYLVTSPRPSIAGVLQTPSDVEVYVDGALVSRLHLPAGEFDLRSLPVHVGGGEVRVLIRDVFGRTREIGREFYATSRLLKRGIQQYAYQLGARRERLGEASFEYGAPAFLAFHRLGLSDTLTLGARAELDAEVVNVGGELGLGITRLGELGLSVAGSRDGGRSGGAASFDWAWRRGALSTGVAAQAFSTDYANLASPGHLARPRLAVSGRASGGLGRQGTVSIFASHELSRQRQDLTRFQLSYVRPLASRLSFTLGTGFAYDTELRAEISAGLTLFLGGRGTAALRMHRERDSSSWGLSGQWRAPLGTGFGADFDLSASELGTSLDPDARARLEYRSPAGVASTEYRRLVRDDGFRAGWAGSFVAVDGRVFASRPVSDGFALIRVADLPDVLVSYNNEPIGRTDPEGELLVPELRSHLQNLLGIEANQVPFGYRIEETTRSVTVPFRGGGRVDFDVRRLRAYEGRVFLETASGREPAAYGRLEIERPTGLLAVPVGTGGALYLEGIEPGAYSARLHHRGSDCRFVLELPDRREPISELGELDCSDAAFAP